MINFCKQCGIQVLDDTQICPLCQCVLENQKDMTNMYPNIRTKTMKMQLVVRIYLFLAIALEVLLVYVNYRTYHGIKWSGIVGFGLAYVYFVLRFAVLNKNTGYKGKAMFLTMVGVGYLVLVDFFAGYHGWAINYVFPSGIIVLDFLVVMLMIVNRRNWQSYIMTEIFLMLLSALSLAFGYFGIVTHLFMSGLAFAISVLVFLGTVIIGDRRARMELRRRFHIR